MNPERERRNAPVLRKQGWLPQGSALQSQCAFSFQNHIDHVWALADWAGSLGYGKAQGGTLWLVVNGLYEFNKFHGVGSEVSRRLGLCGRSGAF